MLYINELKTKCCREDVFYVGFHVNFPLTLDEGQRKLKEI